MTKKSKPAGEIGILRVRGESSKFLSAADIAARIENMVETPEGTLRSLNPPCALVPKYSAAGVPPSGTAAAGGADAFTYGTNMHGICHATFTHTGREILLIATGGQIWEFEGWNRGWKLIVGDSVSAVYRMDLEDTTRPQWPMQFVTTPTGIIILPYEGRPLFYDGEVCAELGYSQVPGAPQLIGPQSPNSHMAAGEVDRSNTSGYAHDGNPQWAWNGAETYQTQMHPNFGRGRVGTIAIDTIALDTETHGGALDQGAYAGSVQWVDRWGNLSPVSGRSAVVAISAQSSHTEEGTYRPDNLLKQMMWRGISPGPGTTVGRILYRTKDMLHAGTQRLFEMPAYAQGIGNGFSTVPDNIVEAYPDNIPDSWLLRESQQLTTTPRARLGALAFGRFFVANTPDDPGVVRWSQLGRWGTWGLDDFLYPDPNAAEITGLHNSMLGLLVFTESSTFLVRQSDDGQGFLLTTVSTYAGCVAPSSIKTLRDGSIVWLGREGFYRMNLEGVLELVSETIDNEMIGLNPGRKVAATAAVDIHTQEYRCWVAVEGSTVNNRCYVLDEQGWRRRTDLAAVADVCTTKDHRALMLAVGKVSTYVGVWVLDHSNTWYKNAVDSIIETAWLEPESSWLEGMGVHARLWFREASSGAVRVTVYRDWRQDQEVDNGKTVKLYRSDDAPPFWDTAVYGTGVWRKRRPFWTYADVMVPKAQAVKFKISSPSSGSKDWEFIGLTFAKKGRFGQAGFPI